MSGSTMRVKKYLNAISEPNRFAILQLLKRGKRCACEIHPALGLKQNLSSHHLKVLKDLDLLESKKQGTKIIYSRNEKAIRKYQSSLTKAVTKRV